MSDRIDFNAIGAHTPDLIPAGTIVKVRMLVKNGGYGPDGALTKSKQTGVLYINALLIVLEGTYAARQIFARLGVQEVEPGREPGQWVRKGLRQLRAILESARNVRPTDMSESAKEKRRIRSYQEFDHLEFLIKVGVENPHDPRFSPQNYLQYVVTPDWPEFAAYTAQLPPTPGLSSPGLSTRGLSSPGHPPIQGNPYRLFAEQPAAVQPAAEQLP